MNKKKILFRADANPDIGIGDLMSLIHLAKYFEAEGWQTHFIIKSYPAGLKLIDKYEVKKYFVIDKLTSIKDEVKTINRFVKDNNIDLIFFEITERKLEEYKGIIPDVYKACVSFDGSMLPDMNLVINWDVVALKFFEPQNHFKTKFLFGHEYVILPIEFDKERIENRINNIPPKKLLICMGGADEHNLTSQVVQRLIEQKIKCRVTIIIGSGYEDRKDLEYHLNSADFKFVLKENITNMFEEYLNCDMAIGTGGLVSSELVATHTPCLLVAAYKHQKARCKYFNKNGWAKYLGSISDLNESYNSLIDGFHANYDLKPDFNTQRIVDVCNSFLN